MNKDNFLSRQDFWKALIAEQKKSGLSQAQFCKARGVALSSFCSWLAKLNKLPKSQAKDFARVELVTDTSKKEPMRIVFQSGATLYFAERPEAEFLAELVRLVS